MSLVPRNEPRRPSAPEKKHTVFFSHRLPVRGEEERAAPPSSAALIRVLYPSLPRSRYVADLTRDAVRHRRTVGPAGVKLGTAYDFAVRQYGLMVEKELSEDAVPVGRPSRRHPV